MYKETRKSVCYLYISINALYYFRAIDILVVHNRRIEIASVENESSPSAVTVALMFLYLLRSIDEIRFYAFRETVY